MPIENMSMEDLPALRLGMAPDQKIRGRRRR